MKKQSLCFRWYLTAHSLAGSKFAFCVACSKVITRLSQLLFGCYINAHAEIDPSCSFPHNGLGVVINGDCKIGGGTVVYQQVTLGVSNAGGAMVGSSPSIGRNCIIGTGAKILGGITVGDNCRIGANAVVLKDVPDNSTAVGVPARIIPHASDGEVANAHTGLMQ